MARQKTLPARRQSAYDDSLLIRSAESLGRMIGSLQRQLDAARHAAGFDGGDVDVGGNGHAPSRTRVSGATKAGKKKGKTGSSATKVRSAPDGPSKRTAKSAAARRAETRSRTGAKARAAKTGRRT